MEPEGKAISLTQGSVHDQPAPESVMGASENYLRTYTSRGDIFPPRNKRLKKHKNKDNEENIFEHDFRHSEDEQKENKSKEASENEDREEKGTQKMYTNEENPLEYQENEDKKIEMYSKEEDAQKKRKKDKRNIRTYSNEENSFEYRKKDENEDDEMYSDEKEEDVKELKKNDKDKDYKLFPSKINAKNRMKKDEDNREDVKERMKIEEDKKKRNEHESKEDGENKKENKKSKKEEKEEENEENEENEEKENENEEENEEKEKEKKSKKSKNETKASFRKRSQKKKNEELEVSNRDEDKKKRNKNESMGHVSSSDISVKILNPNEINELNKRDEEEKKEEDERSDTTVALNQTQLPFKVDLKREGYQENQEEYTGFLSRELTKESINTVKEIVNKNIPLNENNKRFQSKDIDTKWLPCKEIKKNDFSGLAPFGVGYVLYFQVLKVYSLVFFLLTLINAFLIFIYAGNHPEKKILHYNDLFFKSTIGNIGSLLTSCIRFPISEIRKNNNTPYNITLNCGDYTISKIAGFGSSPDLDSVSKNNLSCFEFAESLQLSIDNNEEFVDRMNSMYECKDKNVCSFEEDLGQMLRNDFYFTNDNFYLVYTCYDKTVLWGKTEHSRKYLPFLVVGIDCCGSIILLIVLMIISVSHKYIKKYYRENLIQINDFTIHIEDLGFKMETIEDELDELFKHLHKVFVIKNLVPKRVKDEEYHTIFDFTIPLVTDEKLLDVENAIKRNKSAIKKNKENDNENKSINHKKITKNYETPKEINEIYITFINQKYRNTIHEVYYISKCKSCCIVCCKLKKYRDFLFRGKWLKVTKYTEQPSNIVWKNVTFSPYKRCCRKFAVVLLSIVILLVPFACAFGMKYFKEELNKKYNTDLDCDKLEKFSESVVYEEFTDATLTDKEKYKTYCFCYERFQNKKSLKDYQLNGVYPCKDWSKLYAQNLAINVGLTVLVPVINVVLSCILEIISSWERNKTVSQKYTSIMIKIFIFQLINTAVLILLINMYISNFKNKMDFFPFFQGEFRDTDPSWYSTVGVSILFTMLLNVVTPHMSYLFSCILYKMKVCCDKKKNELGTKCKKVSEYIELHSGGEFNISARYASIATTVFVILIYSPGMPLLYFCGFLFFFIMYWVDKCLLLKFYRYPPKIDLFLDTYNIIIIFIGLILHLLFGIWIYGNERIFSNEDSVAIFSGLKEKLEPIISSVLVGQDYYVNAMRRVIYSHNLIILIVLIITIVFFFIRLFCMKKCCGCCKCCKVDTKQIDIINIYDSLKIKNIPRIFNVQKAFANNFEGKIREFYIEKNKVGKKKMKSSIKWSKEEERRLKDNFDDTFYEKVQSLSNEEKGKSLFEVNVRDYKGKSKEEKKEIQKIDREFTYHPIEKPEDRDFAYYFIYLNKHEVDVDN